MRHVIIVSGPIAVGKSAFIGELVRRFGAVRISTRELIQSLRSVQSERRALQEAGDELDRATDGKWVADALAARASTLADDAFVIVDSVRIAKQVEHLRRAFGSQVWHVHLTAPDEVLSRRFLSRKLEGDPTTYAEARANATEAEVEKLGAIADQCIDTDRLDPGAVATLAAESLKLPPKS